MLPKLTGLTPEDIAEFENLLDDLPYRYAKFLSQWLDRRILAQFERNQQNAAEVEALSRQIEAERQASDTPAARIDAFVEQVADDNAPASPLNNIH